MDGSEQPVIVTVSQLELSALERIAQEQGKSVQVLMREAALAQYGLMPKKENSGKEQKPYITILMPRTNTYALGVQAIRDAYDRRECPHQPTFTKDEGSKIPRPLTFEENVEAMVEDYETLVDEKGNQRTPEERLNLFTQTWHDSCTGIANKRKSTKFKINPECSELIQIPSDFIDSFLSVEYDSLSKNDGWVELDSSKKGLYNQGLNQSQILEQPAWLISLKGKKMLLKAVSGIVYANRPDVEKLMGFYVEQNAAEDKLRALYVIGLVNGCYVNGYDNLSISGSFLLRSPSPKKFEQK